MQHEVKRDNEEFVGNVRVSEFPRNEAHRLKTARLGEQAYDLYGKKISKKYMLPLFIDRSERDVYSKIMMQGLKG